MTLRTQMTADVTAVFLETDDFAESVVYLPHQHFGATARANRTINAIVVRDPLAILSEDGDAVTPSLEIHVANDVTNGITSSELNTGGDKIRVSLVEGGATSDRTITRRLSHDHAMMILEVK